MPIVNPKIGSPSGGHDIGDRFALFRPVRSWILYAGFLGMFINALLLATPIYMLQIYDRVLISHSIQTLLMLTVITVALVAVYALLDTIRGRLLLRAGIVLEQVLGPRVLERVHQFEQRGAHAGSGAELVRDVSTLRNYFSSPHLVALFDSPWVVIFTVLIFGFAWVLGVITLIGMLALMILALADEKLTYRSYTRAQQATQRASHFAHASVANAEVVNALGMQDAIVRIWQGLANAGLEALKGAADRGGVISGITKSVRILIQIAMLGAGAYLVIADHLSPGIMIAATIIVARAIGPVETVISAWRTFVEARAAHVRLHQALHGGPQASRQAAVDLPRIRGGLLLDNVGFAIDARAPILQGVSVRLEPGDALGITGPSGSGKSVLARIILGLIRPTQGRVVVDGHDISHYDRQAFGRQLGYLPQDVEIFPGTIAENVSRMQESTEHSEEIVRLGSWIPLDPFVSRLPMGYATVLNTNSLNLSGGQRQLVGLARAFFGSPRFIVLDEPDANLDQQGETNLLRLIDQVREDKLATLIVISHNPRIIDRMTRMLILQDGTAKQLVRQPHVQGAPETSAAVIRKDRFA